MIAGHRRLWLSCVALVCALPWPAVVAATRDGPRAAGAAQAFVATSDQNALATTPPAERKPPVKGERSAGWGTPPGGTTRPAAAVSHPAPLFNEGSYTECGTHPSCATLCRFLI